MKNTSPLLRLIFAPLVAILALTSFAPANGYPTLYWLGTNGTTWTAGNNWSQNSTSVDPASGPLTDAYINFSAISTNSSTTDLGGDLSISSLTIDTTDAVGISGGNLTINGNTRVGNGTLEIATGGSINSTSDLFVGTSSGSNGTFHLNGGSVNNKIGYLGDQAGSVGTAIVSSGNWTNTEKLYVGNTGTGNLTISGGIVSAPETFVAAGAGNVGTVSVNGGTWNSGSLKVGFTGNGTLNLAGGSINSGISYLGGYASYVGVANVTNGTWTSNSDLNIGFLGVGSLNISGAGNVTNRSSYIGLLEGASGSATVSGGTWTNSVDLVVGNAGTGSLTINGTGTVIVGGTLSRGSNGTINLESGGTLQIGTGGDAGTLATDLTNNGTLIFNLTGSSEDTHTISGTGTLTKNGAGALILSGNNAYTGGTTISAGTLSIGDGGTSGSVTGDITNNAALVFSRSDDSTHSGTISGTGSLTKNGSGILTLSGNNTYTGGTSIIYGTLWTKSAGALGNGSATLGQNFAPVSTLSLPAASPALLVSSKQEMGDNLLIGGNLDWHEGKIAFFDTETSPGSGDLTINVAGNFTVSTFGNATFDFSGVTALGTGNYTLVNATVVTADNSKFTAVHGQDTQLFGNFTTTGNMVVYNVTGATSGGRIIQNKGGPNTPIIANFNVTESTVTIGLENTVNALTFTSSAPLAIQSNGELTVTSGTLAVQNGSSVVSGGTLKTPGNLDKTGTGELDLQSSTNVTGIATVVEGFLSVNGQLIANSVVVNPNATLGGAGLIVGNVNVKGNLSPGNSPGTLAIAGNLALTGANSTLIEIASPTNFDRIVVSGSANLGGALNVVEFGGFELAYGQQYAFLTAGGGISGEFDTITAPETFRGRFLNLGTTGVLLIAPDTYTRVAVTPNQRKLAKALDSFIPVTSGDRETVSIALDLQTAEQYPYAFEQIMPGFYESLANIAIEQAFAQTQMLNQRISSVRLGAAGFQAIGGISQPLLHDKNGKSAAEAKDASSIVESATATNWNSWALGTGMFSRSTNLPNLQNYNNDAGGFLVGADYRWSENFVSGLYTGYDYSYAEYNGGGSTKGNSVNFGTYASYAKDGYYADAVIGGGYTGFQTKRSIQFSKIDRTASADPNSGQFTAGINLGKDFEVGQFTLGPIIGAQYTYAGIGTFTESGAESLDLSLAQQNANSLRSTLGGRIAYTWNLNQKIAIIPEVRMFWQHEFLNNARNINASLDGGNGAAFDFETTDPYRNSVFAGAGVTAQFGERWNASLFYNVNFGSQTYQSNMVSAGLNFSF